MEETKKEELENGTTDQTGDNSGENSSTNDNSGNSGNGTSYKTFTQEQVNRMMASEKNQGRAAAYREMGIDPKDTRMVAMFKAFIESQKTDDEKNAQQQAEQLAQLTKAEQRASLAEAKAEALTLGANREYVDDVVTLAMSKMSANEGSDIKTVIGELKTKYPVWFGEEPKEDKKDLDKNSSKDKDNKDSVGQKGTGSSIKGSSNNSKDGDKGIGHRLAVQRRGTKSKTSFWD